MSCGAWRVALWNSAWTRSSKQNVSADDIIATLKQSGAPGQAWLEELEVSRHPWFNINVGDGFITITAPGTTTCRCRLLPARIYQAGEVRNSLERPIERLQAERQELIEGYRELLSTDEDRAAYDQMITLAHRVFPMSRATSSTASIGTRISSSTRFASSGCFCLRTLFPATEDVFQLTHYELEWPLSIS